MSGEGTGGTPRRPIALRLLISMGTAVFVVLIASRVNRPTGIRVLSETPPLASQILQEVQIDTSSLPAAVEALNRASHGKVRLNALAFSQDELLPTQSPAPQTLHNVHLGTAVEIATTPWPGYSGHLSWHEEGGFLVIASETSATQQTLTCLYDVRDILHDAKGWWDDAQNLERHNARWSGGGGLFGGSSSPLDDGTPSAHALAILFKESFGDDHWDDPALNWYADGWGGWMIVRASPQAHRDLELFLMLLRRGDSEDASQIGPRP